jgi:hypothetical protein
MPIFAGMQLTLVTGTGLAQQFIKVAVLLYKNDSNWIQPLDKDINDTFDKKKNKAWRFGEAVRWILKDEKGNLLGRIAAFTNKKYRNKGDDIPVGGIGFFECINNQYAANMLLDKAKEWLQQHGMEAMDGPINFGERDKWWGMVTDGFESPMYSMNYNPPYYVTLFANYGFKTFFNQVCFGMEPQKPLEQKIWDRHNAIEQLGGFSSSTIKKNNLEKFAADFATVYNKAWAGHGGLKEMNKEQVMLIFKKMKPVMDENLVWFAYHNNEPVAIFINIPDLNHWFKYLKGKFGLLQKLKFLWVKAFIPNNKFTGLVFGVVPEWQGRGVDAYIIAESAKVIQRKEPPRYEKYEMQWIGDFNPKMLNIAASIGNTYRSRNLATFRYLFDQTQEFKRHPILD